MRTKAIPREEWPEWLQRLKMPWRFIGGRAAEANRICNLFGLTRNRAFHYTSPEQVAHIQTIWPWFVIELDEHDDVAAFVTARITAQVVAGGMSVIRIPRSVMVDGEFPVDTSLVASTLVEMARRKEREAKKAARINWGPKASVTP
jgi:hypothetical protein